MPSALILYHYFHPDDVVSAQIMTGLALGLHDRGWSVGAKPSNRSCHDEFRTYPDRETWKGILISRVIRPKFRQSSAIGRLFNAIFMTTEAPSRIRRVASEHTKLRAALPDNRPDATMHHRRS